MKTLGQRVRALRRQRKWTQQRLGEAIGRSQQEIYRWEKGLVRIPAEDLVMLARVFEVSVMTFFPQDDAPVAACATYTTLSEALHACAQHAAAMASALQDVAFYTDEAGVQGGQEQPHV